MIEHFICEGPEQTFELGETIGNELNDGDVILLCGGLGAGKTLLTKGILSALEYDIDEVTSPSFTLVNHYRTQRFDVYHIDLWRLDGSSDIAANVGLDEILNAADTVTIIEWAEKLKKFAHTGRIVKVSIEGDGDNARTIAIEWPEPV